MYNTDDSINYGEIIKALRKKHKMTQSELGECISVGKTAISNYEIGYSIPSARVMEKIASAFDMTFVDFLTYNYENNSLSNVDMPRRGQATAEILIPYIKEENVREGIIEANNYMDASMIFPEFMFEGNKNYICVKIPDNSMSDEAIFKNDYAIIKKSQIIKNKQIVLALNTDTGKFVIRRYIREGHIASLIANSSSDSYEVMRVDERDEKFSIVGYVEKIISSVK